MYLSFLKKNKEKKRFLEHVSLVLLFSKNLLLKKFKFVW